ncbi:hypothetical protein [Burkholderia plantarii]|uniref:hypothetical protein n=1 Tax=Burkholderia plantarii TaxID=41899 RepID=UPI000F4FA604|nr:hypothetical protein [Burkholderia plantarii]
MNVQSIKNDGMAGGVMNPDGGGSRATPPAIGRGGQRKFYRPAGVKTGRHYPRLLDQSTVTRFVKQ